MASKSKGRKQGVEGDFSMDDDQETFAADDDDFTKICVG